MGFPDRPLDVDVGAVVQPEDVWYEFYLGLVHGEEFVHAER